MSRFLTQIVTKKRQELKTLKQSSGRFVSLFKTNNVVIIGEIKFASPSAGVLGNPDEFLGKIKQYEESGVNALSIITERNYFNGKIDYITQARKATMLPILQKDFIIDQYQIYEAKHAGADALLLIARLLSQKKLIQFVKTAKQIGIEPVVEVFSKQDLQKALQTQTKIIAVNARDLESFAIDKETAAKTLKTIPSKYIKLGFSGISSARDVKQYQQSGADGVLIGTSLMKSKNIGEFMRTMI